MFYLEIDLLTSKVEILLFPLGKYLGLEGYNSTRSPELKKEKENAISDSNGENTKETSNEVASTSTVRHSLKNSLLKDLKDDLKNVSNNLEILNRRQLIEFKWNYTANIVDRLLFVMTLIYFLGIFVSFMISFRNFFDHL